MTKKVARSIVAPQEIDGEYPFEVLAENVIIKFYDSDNNEKRITLQQFYNYVQEFFNIGDFIAYGDTPPVSQNVKLWYNTGDDQIGG